MNRAEEYRLEYKERHRINCNRWYHKNSIELASTNPKLLLLRRIRNSSKQRGIECTITVDDFEIPNNCPILGLPLQFHKGKRCDNSVSMDRIDSDKGYIPGNVQVISWLANRIKNDMTPDQLEKLYRFVFKL